MLLHLMAGNATTSFELVNKNSWTNSSLEAQQQPADQARFWLLSFIDVLLSKCNISGPLDSWKHENMHTCQFSWKMWHYEEFGNEQKADFHCRNVVQELYRNRASHSMILSPLLVRPLSDTTSRNRHVIAVKRLTSCPEAKQQTTWRKGKMEGAEVWC